MSDMDSFTTPKNLLIGLIDGVSTRPYKYNSISGEYIVKNCFNQKFKALITGYEDTQTVASMDLIKYQMRAEYLDRFKEAFKTIKTTDDLKEIIIEGKIWNPVITKSLMPNSLRIGRKHMTEYMISFASGFNELRRELRKALKISYDKEKLADFSDRLHDTSIQRKELLDELLKVIDVIITRALTIVQEKKLFIKQLENIKLHLSDKMLY